jgi:hypothetical protein
MMRRASVKQVMKITMAGTTPRAKFAMTAGKRHPLFTISFLLICLGVSVGWLHFAVTNSWFIIQDLDHLMLLQDTPLIQFLVTPIDMHLPLPLHRLFCWIVFEPLHLSYASGVTCLVVIHLITGLYMWMLLNQISKGWVNYLFVVMYLANYWVLDLFVWWSAGLHRMPYLCASVACCYHGINYAHCGKKRDLVVCAALVVTGLGFFEKAILIPAYVGATLLSLRVLGGEVSLRRTWVVVSVLSMTAGVYVGVISALQGQFVLFSTLRWTLWVFKAVKLQFIALSQSLLPMSYKFGGGVEYLVLGLWLAVLCYSCWYSRRSALVWAMFSTLVLLNLLALSLSDRLERYGLLVVLLQRYAFDNVFLVLLLLGFLGRAVAWSEGGEKGGGRLVRVVVVLVALAFSLTAYFGAIASERAYYRDFGGPRAVRFIEGLRGSLESVRGQPEVMVAERGVLEFLYPGATRSGKTVVALSRITRYWARNLVYVEEREAAYAIDDAGRLVALKGR